jgi:hypothetical protein
MWWGVGCNQVALKICNFLVIFCQNFAKIWFCQARSYRAATALQRTVFGILRQKLYVSCRGLKKIK